MTANIADIIGHILDIIVDNLIIFFVIIITLCVLYILWNFPWILKYYTITIYRDKTNADDTILIASDLHLELGQQVPKSLVRYIEQNSINVVVFAGDLMEYRRNVDDEVLVSILEDMLSDIIKIQAVHRIYYITSTSSHDPKIKHVTSTKIHGKPIIIIPGALQLEVGGTEFFISHCDYACRNGAVARVINKLMKKLGRSLYIENLMRKKLDIPEDTWIICGHTHIPGIDLNRKLANTGCWKRRVLIKSTETAILIKNSKPKLVIPSQLIK